MTVWVIIVNGKTINSVWATEQGALSRIRELIEFHGDALAVRCREFQVRS